MLRVGSLAVRVPALRPEDTIARAAEALRAAPTRVVPVAREGRLEGVLVPADLAALLEASPEVLARLPISVLPLRAVPMIPATMPAREALALLRDQRLEAVPVLDESGRYLGMVGLGELLSAVCGTLRPPHIGGMATPFGVYLTTGSVRAGVGDLALFSSGVFMGLALVLGAYLAEWLLRGVADTLPWLYSSFGVTLIAVLIFALLFRMSWVAGFHAAEHQVVHTIEQGEDLVPANVRAKPRVHPRCGTNIAVALTLLFATWELGQQLSDVLPGVPMMLGLILVYVGYRPLGALAQLCITTRPASPGQIENGIRAGEELLRRYQGMVGIEASPLRRVWNTGLLQVSTGLSLTLMLVNFIGPG